jgi:hypothetical protein
MADDRLREVEREAAWGDPAGRARLLVERVRAGQLEHERLRLAAWLGDRAACLATGEAGGPGAAASGSQTRRGRRDAWTRALAAWGKEAIVRAAYVVARDELRHWRRHYRDDASLPGVLDAVAAWIGCPCDPCARAVGRAVEAGALPEGKDNRSGRAKWHVVQAALAARAPGDEAATAHALEVMGESPAGQVRDAIRRALVPWALGHEPDPAPV